MPPLNIWIAANLDFQCEAAQPRNLPLSNQVENALDRFGFGANALLPLIVGQPVQAARIKV